MKVDHPPEVAVVPGNEAEQVKGRRHSALVLLRLEQAKGFLEQRPGADAVALRLGEGAGSK